MLKKYFFAICVLLISYCFAQQETPTDTLALYKNYREDQFYIGATYNVLLYKPEEMRTRGLTGGIYFGYLRDIPLNKRRNIAIAIGLGASFDEYGNTLFIGETEQEQTIFTVLDDNDVAYDRNRFSTSDIELPLQFRWRSSTAATYKFWRIYAGVRLGYTYWYKAFFKQPNNEVVQTDIPEFNKMRLGTTLSFGYNTVNVYAYYGITPFFKNAVTTAGTPIRLRTLKLGLIFYIL